MPLVQREMDVARTKPKPLLSEAATSAFEQLTSVRRGRQLPAGDSRSASYPAADVHQAQITLGNQ